MSTYRGSGTPSTGTIAYADASDVVNTPLGDISSTNVQDAINELNDEKVSIAGSTMTGDLTVPNLVTAGNVDGRDVSVDGTALDSAVTNISNLTDGTTTHTGFNSTGIDDNATATAITIDASENVGIGATPEAWAVGTKALQLSVSTAISETSFNSYYSNNAYYDGVWKARSTSFCSRYTNDGGGEHIFDVAPITTLDTAITWTNVLTLENSGNTTFGGDVSLGDSKHLYLGAGNDLDIYHTSTQSHIVNGTGILYIQNTTASNLIRIEAANSVGTAKTAMTLGGATPKVDQYYDGAVTTSTSATGFDLAAGKELTLDRTTDDDGFINFKATIGADATSAVSSFTTSAATTHHIQILINGTPAWIAVSTTDPTA